jgi:hypothetical protein
MLEVVHVPLPVTGASDTGRGTGDKPVAQRMKYRYG